MKQTQKHLNNGLIVKGLIMRVVYRCKHCQSIITREKAKVSQGYFGACLNCDEDFIKLECIKVKG